MPADFQPVYDRLKGILEGYADRLQVKNDAPGDYVLIVGHVEKHKREIWFGAVQIKKSYVSYHLIPVYMFPDLLDGVSPELKARMQGKSCFNFKALTDEQIQEIEALTRRGFERFQAEGIV